MLLLVHIWGGGGNARFPVKTYKKLEVFSQTKKWKLSNVKVLTYVNNTMITKDSGNYLTLGHQ